MDKSWYSVEVSIGWVIFVLLLAASVSWLLYSQKGLPWRRNVSILLGFLRFSALGMTAALLLDPLIHHLQNSEEKPKVIFAVDDSRSAVERLPESDVSNLKDQIRESYRKLSDFGYDPVYKSLSGKPIDSLDFTHETSNLSSFLKDIEKEYGDLNVGAAVLISDGIVNQGADPRYTSVPFPVYTVGLGDTIPSRDISIQSVNHNKVAFQGNKFPVRVDIFQNGFDSKNVDVTISEGQKVVSRESLVLEKKFQSLMMILEASNPGLKRYSVSVTQASEEITHENNTKEFYIEVIEGKERVLILASAPHPDINAIRLALSGSENYETEVYIPGLNQQPKELNFSVVIVHGAFSGPDVLAVPGASYWWIFGNRTRIDLAEQRLTYFKFKPIGQQTDNVRPAINRNFSRFKLNEKYYPNLENFPPVSTLFGEYTVTGPTEVLLSQQVGSVDTGKPLMAFYDDGSSKSAITVGSGFWMWRLQEGALYGEAPLFDELITKTVQYLGLKSNKKRFVARSRLDQYNENETVYIDMEVYDAVFDRKFGNTITLELTNESGSKSSFQIVDGPSASMFWLGSLPSGVYTFTATTADGTLKLTDKGEFIVKKTQLEALDLTANHEVLRQISQKSGGQFFQRSELSKLNDQLGAASFSSLIRTENQLLPAIRLIWILGLIVLLLSSEWFLRKLLGAY